VIWLGQEDFNNDNKSYDSNNYKPKGIRKLTHNLKNGIKSIRNRFSRLF